MKTILEQLSDYRLMHNMRPPMSSLLTTERVNGVTVSQYKQVVEVRDGEVYERFSVSEVIREVQV
jgi:hypothetical protein